MLPSINATLKTYKLSILVVLLHLGIVIPLAIWAQTDELGALAMLFMVYPGIALVDYLNLLSGPSVAMWLTSILINETLLFLGTHILVRAMKSMTQGTNKT